MKASPLTARSLDFLRVHVQADYQAEQAPDQFDFDGALLSWSIKHGQSDDGSWWVAVGFATDPEAQAGQRCPYDLDLRVMGVFTIAETVAPERREAIVYESGAALVYGAIREMVANITARCITGKLMLPTPTFMGAFEDRKR